MQMSKSIREFFKLSAVCCALTVLGAQAQGVTATATNSGQLDTVLGVGSGATSTQNQIGYAREQILREAATALGARAGLSDRSQELMSVLNSRVTELDIKFNFNPFVMGAGVLPPVISESRDIVSMGNAAMRVAGAVFHIDEPARFAMPAPTWRNWLYVGLDSTPVVIPSLGNNGPVTPAEKELWQRVVKEGYELGRTQANAVFDANLALLERVHSGMRRYFDLWQRGMVSAPIIASNTDVVLREDANTIAVGNTLYRITAPTDFKAFQKWIPLE